MVTAHKIKVLVIDGSLYFREAIARGISRDSSIEVVGTAFDAFEARDMIMQLSPDVLTLDMEMPGMNGIEFLRKLMPQYPLPVVVVSGISSNVFTALNAGAVDFAAKPEAAGGPGMQAFIRELADKVKIASIAKVGHFKKGYCCDNITSDTDTDYSNNVIAVGAATGGIEAITQLVGAFSRDMCGMVIVQHMPPVFTRMYAERLNRICRMEVKEAEDGDWVGTGRVLLAPGDCHMTLENSGEGYYVKCRRDEKINGQRPSIDVLFDSVAASAGSNAVGVLLTGMGGDGPRGLLNLKNCGAWTIGQDEKTCVVYGMPMEAYNMGAVMKLVPLEKIPGEISGCLAAKRRVSAAYAANMTRQSGMHTLT
jgi:two-component system chemotaxis response regulator CheB